ncbi:MAG: hypothetical protein KDD43_14850 [Bdellovibrionales bacterium]|nr:hypothetical protein [Bdellovibrionales bacterium]
MSHSHFKAGAELWSQFLAELGKSAFLVGPMCEFPPTHQGPGIFVDGGARWFREPGISVGDGDSWDQTPQVLLHRDKDFSDLAFVLRSLPSNIKLIEIVGFLGGHRDHELFNLGEVHRFLNQFSGRIAHLDQSVLGFSAGTWQLEHSGEFSLLSLSQGRIQLDGDIHYPLTASTEIQPLDSRGLSNVAEGLISITTSGPAFVFLRT